MFSKSTKQLLVVFFIGTAHAGKNGLRGAAQAQAKLAMDPPIQSGSQVPERQSGQEGLSNDLKQITSPKESSGTVSTTSTDNGGDSTAATDKVDSDSLTTSFSKENLSRAIEAACRDGVHQSNADLPPSGPNQSLDNCGKKIATLNRDDLVYEKPLGKGAFGFTCKVTILCSGQKGVNAVFKFPIQDGNLKPEIEAQTQFSQAVHEGAENKNHLMRVYGFSQDPEWVLAELLNGGEISKKNPMTVKKPKTQDCVPGILGDVIAGVREMHSMQFCHGDIVAALNDMNIMLNFKSESECPTAKLIDLDAVGFNVDNRKEDFRQLFEALKTIIEINGGNRWSHDHWKEIRKWYNIFHKKTENKFGGILEDLTPDENGENKAIRLLNLMERAMRKLEFQQLKTKYSKDKLSTGLGVSGLEFTDENLKLLREHAAEA